MMWLPPSMALSVFAEGQVSPSSTSETSLVHPRYRLVIWCIAAVVVLRHLLKVSFDSRWIKPLINGGMASFVVAVYLAILVLFRENRVLTSTDVNISLFRSIARETAATNFLKLQQSSYNMDFGRLAHLLPSGASHFCAINELVPSRPCCNYYLYHS